MLQYFHKRLSFEMINVLDKGSDDRFSKVRWGQESIVVGDGQKGGGDNSKDGHAVLEHPQLRRH